MKALSPVQTRMQQRLSSCSHVFLRVDSVQQPYEGPFRVISCHDKTFKVEGHGRVDTISIDLLKAEHVDENIFHANTKFSANPSKPLIETPVSRSGARYSPATLALDEAPASRLRWQTPQLVATPHEVPFSHLSRQPPPLATVLDDALAPHSGRQPRATVTTSDVTPVSCPSQPDATLSRPLNETSVSRSDRRIVLPARFWT
ncbi:unnamed protein product [Echinostoma caproni]|uniref:Uncharacterized protein n=1 Tax=Echinostoma caproni TaxID=27848 RepID=A0A183BGY6_9TREM|nr:unnamed protein product [Echinostoma caproni]